MLPTPATTGLIEQERLHRPPGRKAFGKGFVRHFQRLRPELPPEGPAFHLAGRERPHLTELARVVKKEKPAVVQREYHPCVLFRRRSGRIDEEPARHAQMKGQRRYVARLPSVQRRTAALRSAGRVAERPARRALRRGNLRLRARGRQHVRLAGKIKQQQLAAPSRSRRHKSPGRHALRVRLSLPRSGVQHVHGRNAPSAHLRRKRARHGFHFGQFRHVPLLTMIHPRSARQAPTPNRRCESRTQRDMRKRPRPPKLRPCCRNLPQSEKRREGASPFPSVNTN